VRVLTWNLWGRFGPWEARQPAIASVVADTGADVVCLQEVWSTEDGVDQARTLAEASGYHWCRTPERFRRGLAVGNAILSRWPIGSHRSLELPDLPARMGHRQVLHAQVDAPFGPVPVFCTHLAYLFDESSIRQQQAAAVAAMVAEHRGEPASAFPAVLCGDLNAVPGSEEVRMLTGERPPPVPGLVFTDTWSIVGDGPGWTWSDDNPHLADAAWPRRRLDYVLVSWPRPKPIGNPVTARLVGTEEWGGVVPSDHYGVLVDLREADAGS
jgi:endonuclease/exonuclease/phosphatase family metal-dependent hydrolase